MVSFSCNVLNPHGHFFLDFTAADTLDFFGHQHTQLQVFRRYGNLPDNNIAVNKLINALGQNLLILQQHHVTPTTQVFHDLEIWANVLTIELLVALAPLEQGRLQHVFDVSAIQQQIVQVFAVAMTQLPLRSVSGFARQEQLLQQRLFKQQQRWKLRLERLSFPISTRQLRDIYLQVLTDFRNNQELISNIQRPIHRYLEFANMSLSEAYHNAFYSLESHVFVKISPADEQLWLMDAAHISSALLPHLHRERALKTFCLLNPAHTYLELRRRIKDSDLQVKQSMALRLYEPLALTKARTQVINQQQFIQSLMLLAAPESPSLALEQYLVPDEGYDLFSALGNACITFGKYFEREMAVKHPVMSASFFLASSLAFGAAGVASTQFAPVLMQEILISIAKALSLNGHLGVSPEQVAYVIQQISSVWLRLCHADGSVIRAVVMNAFALPKLTYTFADVLFNGVDDQDTLTRLAQRLSSDSLEGMTPSEKHQHVLESALIFTGIMSISIALGLTGEFLSHQTGFSKMMGSILLTLVDVPSEIFSNLTRAQDVAEQVMAIVALLMTVKTAALVVIKFGLVYQHMRAHHPPPTAEELEAVKVVGLLFDLRVHSEKLQQWLGDNQLSPQLLHNFSSACQKYPAIARVFASDQLLLQQLYHSAHQSLPEILQAPNSLLQNLWLGCQWIGASILGILSLPLLSLYWILKDGGQHELHETLQSYKFIVVAKALSIKLINPILGIFALPLILLLQCISLGTVNLLMIPWVNDGAKAATNFSFGIMMLLFYMPKVFALSLFETSKRALMLACSLVFDVVRLLGAMVQDLCGPGHVNTLCCIALLGLSMMQVLLLAANATLGQAYAAVAALYDGIYHYWYADQNKPYENFASSRKHHLQASFFSKGLRFCHDAVVTTNTRSEYLAASQFLKTYLLCGIQGGFNAVEQIFSALVLWIRNHGLRWSQEFLQSDAEPMHRLGMM